jgi:hypothetical protein
VSLATPSPRHAGDSPPAGVTQSPPLSPFLSGQWPRAPWLSLLLIVPAVAGTVLGHGWRFAGLVLLAIALATWVSVFVRHRRLLTANARDFAQAEEIRGELGKAAGLEPEPADTGGNARTFSGMRLLDIDHHVGPQVQASIDGWLNHNLGLPFAAGWSGDRIATDTVVQAGGWSLGSLLASGGAVAEFRETGRSEEPSQGTLRVVVPPSWWVAECVNESARRVASPLLAGTHAHDALVASAGQAVARYPLLADDLPARLGVVLRMPQSERPEFTVSGAPLGPGVVLAGTIRPAGETTWAIFPLPLIASLHEIAERYRPTYRFASVYGTRKPRLVIMDR